MPIEDVKLPTQYHEYSHESKLKSDFLKVLKRFLEFWKNEKYKRENLHFLIFY